MGYSIAWIAVRGKSKSEVLSHLSLLDTGEPDEANESPASCAELPGGATLVFFNEIEPPYLEERVLAPLSFGCDVLACQVEEHAMISGSYLYTNGIRVWEVAHFADEGKYHLAVEGNPPDILEHIRSEMQAAQDESGGEDADDDCFFEVPLMLATSYTAYRHDQARLLTEDELRFTKLVPR